MNVNKKNNQQSLKRKRLDLNPVLVSLKPLPKEIWLKIFNSSSNILNLRRVCKIFYSELHPQTSLFKRDCLFNFLCSSTNFNKNITESLFEFMKYLYCNFNRQITFLDTESINIFIKEVDQVNRANKKIQRSNLQHNEQKQEEQKKFIEAINLRDYRDTAHKSKVAFQTKNPVQNLLDMIWDCRAIFPSLKTLSLGKTQSTVKIPPYNIATLSLSDITGNEDAMPEPECPAWQFTSSLKELTTLSCGNINSACFKENGQIFQSDGKDWKRLFPMLQVLTFKKIHYAGINDSKDDSYSQDDDDILITLALNHPTLKELNFNDMIEESIIYFRDLPQLESFYLHALGQNAYLRFSSAALTNKTISNGLVEFSKRSISEQVFKPRQLIKEQPTCKPSLEGQKTLSTILAIQQFYHTLKNFAYYNTAIKSIILCDFLHSNATRSGDDKSFLNLDEFTRHFDNDEAMAYAETIVAFINILEENIHKLPNLRSLSFGTLWFDLAIPAFAQLETLIFTDIIGCSTADHYPSLRFKGKSPKLTTMVFRHINNARLSNNAGKTFMANDWENYFPNLTTLSFDFLAIHHLYFRHPQLEKLFVGTIVNGITLCDLPQVHQFSLQKLDNKESYLELSTLSFQNPHIIHGLVESSKKISQKFK